MTLLKDGRPLAVALSHASRSLMPGHCVCLILSHGIPERRTSHREPDETRYRRGRFEPSHDLLLVRAPAQHDAADVASAVTPRRVHDALAVFAAIEPLDFPDIRLDASVLQRAD